jgi:hypothetical protein
MLNQFNHWHLQHLIRHRIAKAFLHFLFLRLCVRFLKSVNWQIKDAEMSVKLLYLLSVVCVLLWPKIEKSRKQNACGLFGPYTYITNGGVIVLDCGFRSLITNQDLTPDFPFR